MPCSTPLLQVWPNPAGQMTSIWAEKPFEPGQHLVLRNALGCIVREMAVQVQGQTVRVQRAGLPAGLYFLELCTAHGVIAVGKMVWE